MGKRRIAWIGFAVAGAVAAVSASGLAIASGSGADGHAPHVRSHGDRTPSRAARRVGIAPASRSRSQLRAHFALFRRLDTRRSRGVHSAAPPEVQQTLDRLESLSKDRPLLARMQLDFGQTQQVQTGAGRLWVIPGAGGACIVTLTVPGTNGPLDGQSISYLNCNAADGITQRGLVAIGSQPDGTDLIYGLVPDGNASVGLTTPTGAQSNVPVANNAIMATVPAGTSTLAFKNAAGSRVSVPYRGIPSSHAAAPGERP